MAKNAGVEPDGSGSHRIIVDAKAGTFTAPDDRHDSSASIPGEPTIHIHDEKDKAMSSRNTLVRSMRDIGLAAWFGGSLMGAIGLNGAAAHAKSPQERLRISSIGWAKWAPVQIAAIAIHGIGGLGLIGANKTRLIAQQESRPNTG